MQLIRLMPVCLALGLYFASCAPSPDVPEEVPTAEKIIDRALFAHGMEGLASPNIQFTFRERDYGIERDGGSFRYTRSFVDSLGRPTLDELTNAGLRRYRNDSMVVLSPKDSAAYASSVNSVRYFFELPYGLNDAAVNAERLDTLEIDGRSYDRVRITFDESGGGADFEDVYHYFFSRDSGELDYLAYTFEADGGGIRFRKAINKRRVGGLLVQDYINYGVDGDDRDIDSIAERYEAGELPELSRIENTAVRVE